MAKLSGRFPVIGGAQKRQKMCIASWFVDLVLLVIDHSKSDWASFARLLGSAWAPSVPCRGVVNGVLHCTATGHRAPRSRAVVDNDLAAAVTGGACFVAISGNGANQP